MLEPNAGQLVFILPNVGKTLIHLSLLVLNVLVRLRFLQRENGLKNVDSAYGIFQGEVILCGIRCLGRPTMVQTLMQPLLIETRKHLYRGVNQLPAVIKLVVLHQQVEGVLD